MEKSESLYQFQHLIEEAPEAQIVKEPFPNQRRINLHSESEQTIYTQIY